MPIFMTRMGYTAELGYELWVERERALELWDALVEALEPKGMKVIGMTALDLFRIEGGFIIGGIEYDPTVSPYECSLGWSVDLDKGEFQGREALARDKDATELRLTSVTLESGGDAASGTPIQVGGEGGWARDAGGRVALPGRGQDARAGEDPQGPQRSRAPVSKPRSTGRSSPAKSSATPSTSRIGSAFGADGPTLPSSPDLT